MSLRRSELRRTSAPRRHKPLSPRSRKQARRDHRFRAVKLLIFERDGWRCRLCGSPYALTPHHLLPVGQGGSDEPENVVTACWLCHRLIHDHPAWSYEHGWLIRSGGQS